MSEKFIPTEVIDNIPEPTESDWNKLNLEIEDLNKRFLSYQDHVISHEENHRANRNYKDMAGNIIATVKIVSQGTMPTTRTSANYYMAVKKLEALKKYFDLIDNYPDFKHKETEESGLAFPELDTKYHQNQQAVLDAGYADYREAYIYESAKILQAEHKEAA